MAIVTSNASCNPSSLSVSRNNKPNGTISWSKPAVPEGATISSCVLTGTPSISNNKISATVNGTSVKNGTQFSIDLGNTNATTSVKVTTGVSGNSSGTVSFSNLVYTVTYEEAAQVKTYTVTFVDWNGTVLKTQTVEEGSSATAPSNPSRTGYTFTGWDKTFTNVTGNLTVTAQYSIKQYTVAFKDWDGSTIVTRTVDHGSNAIAPSDPNREGYTFIGWDVSFNNITSDLTVTAQYTKNEVSEPEIPEGAIPVEKTVALRPISVTQDSGYNNTWTNITNTYDTDTSTNGTIIVTGSSQSGFKRKYVDTIFNFDNPIPANAIINSAVLTIRAKQSATTNLNITVSIGSHEVIGSTLLSSSSANYTADVANYVKDLNQLNINLTSAATSNRTFTLYDVRVDVNYTAYEVPEEPEEEIIEWTGIGTIATNISTENDWTYKLNIDWDTQYIEINNIVVNGEAFSYGADVLYMNNEYNFTTGETFYIDDTGTLVINGDSTEFYSFKFSIKISKNDGLVFTSNLNDNTYEIKNYHLIENSSVLYLSSLVRTSGNSYSTIGEIKVKSVEELKENIFPSFTTEEWGTNGTFTIIEESDHNIRFTTDAPWSGPLYYAPYYWQGKTITLSCDTMSENTKFDIMTTSWGALFELTPENSPLTVTLPNEPIMFCLQSSAPDAGVAREVYATGLRITSEDSFENVPDAITSLNINKDIYYVGLSEEIIISCTVTPSDGVFGNLTWTANNPDLLLIEDGKSCIAVSDVIGNYTLTVTDSLTGLSDSCNVVVDDVTNSELFPPFTNGEWYLNSTCTEILKEDYSYSFECTEPWTAVSISIPDYWYGKSIEISCEDISENAGLYIQETDSWVEIGRLTLSSKSAILHVPNKGDYTDIIIALQAPTTPGIVSITNVTASLYGLDNDEDDGEGDIVEDFYNGKINLQYENRLIGYKKPDAEEIVEDAIICTNIGEVSRALSSVQPGQTIYLRRGKYVFGGSFIIRAAGTEGNYITIKGYPGESVIIAETKLEFANPAKYLNFENLIIANVPDLHWGYAIKVHSGTSYINFRNLEIRNITCKIPEGSTETTTGCNPLVIYGDTVEGINNVNVENCYIHDCDTGWSEGLTLNGHVSNCLIKNCTIANITNIGIDLAGNYEWTGTVGDPENQTHDCIVENCLLVNCQSPYATSAGLYSDGARDNTFRYNVMYNCQCGIELGSEQPGAASENFYIHNNLIIDSGRAIGVGSYQETGALNRNAYIYNNTIVCGDSNKENYGLYVERTDNVNFYNNIVYGTSNTTLFSNYYNSNVNVGNNCWYQPNGSKPEIDSTGIFENHIFINNDLTLDGDYSLRYTSPCINKGNSEVFDSEETFDLAGNPRIIEEGIDIGAFEYSGQPEEPENPSGIIARYTASASGVLPTFNEGYQYTVDETVSNGIYTVELYSDTDFTSCSFNGKINLLTVEYLRVTNNVTDMSKMFYNCTSLTTLDASNWNTSNVTNMNNMFQYCNKLTSLNIPNMKFDKLTTITNFLQNSGIKQLNFSRNTLPEISMTDFMNDATSLNVIKCKNKNNIAKVIPHLPVRTVENPGKIITQVPISQFTELEIQALADKNWAISNEELVVVAKYKFAKDICRSMIPVFNEEFTNYFVDDEYLDTEDLTGMYKSLPNKSNGESGKADYTITADNIVTRTISVLVDDVKPYNIRFGSHVINVSSTTKDRHKSGSIIEILDLNISTNYDAALMFNCCVNMINCNINGLNTDAALSMYGMFADCCKLTTLDIDHLNVIKVQDFEAMFSNCESLTSLDVSNFNTGKVTYMNYMFYNCSNLTSLDLSNFDTSEVNYMSYMFYNCSNLTSLDVSSFNTSKVTDMNCMFEGCCSLAQLDLSNFDTSKVIDMYSMFYDCSNLTTLDLSNFDTSQVTDMSYIFDSCTNLISVNMDNSDIDSINDIITAVPTRTANSMGTIKTGSIDPESVNYTEASSKYWIISSDSTNIKHMHLGDMVISNLYIGEVEVKRIYLGEIIIYK